MKIEFKKNSRGKCLLIVDSYPLHRNKLRNGKCYWACPLRKSISCPSRAITSKEGLSCSAHNHDVKINDSDEQFQTEIVDSDTSLNYIQQLLNACLMLVHHTTTKLKK